MGQHPVGSPADPEAPPQEEAMIAEATFAPLWHRQDHVEVPSGHEDCRLHLEAASCTGGEGEGPVGGGVEPSEGI